MVLFETGCVCVLCRELRLARTFKLGDSARARQGREHVREVCLRQARPLGAQMVAPLGSARSGFSSCTH